MNRPLQVIPVQLSNGDHQINKLCETGSGYAATGGWIT